MVPLHSDHRRPRSHPARRRRAPDLHRRPCQQLLRLGGRGRRQNHRHRPPYRQPRPRQTTRAAGPLSKLVVVTYGKLAAEELRVRTRDLLLRHLDQSAIGRQTLLADLRARFSAPSTASASSSSATRAASSGCRKTSACWKTATTTPCGRSSARATPSRPSRCRPVCWNASAATSPSINSSNSPGSSAPTRRTRRPDFDPDEPPPAAEFLRRPGRRRRPLQTQDPRTPAHLARWIEDFDGGAPFVELPEYKGGSRTFLEAVAAATQPYAHWLNAAAGALAVRLSRGLTAITVWKRADDVPRPDLLVRPAGRRDPPCSGRLRRRGYRRDPRRGAGHRRGNVRAS